MLIMSEFVSILALSMTMVSIIVGEAAKVLFPMHVNPFCPCNRKDFVRTHRIMLAENTPV